MTHELTLYGTLPSEVCTVCITSARIVVNTCIDKTTMHWTIELFWIGPNSSAIDTHATHRSTFDFKTILHETKFPKYLLS